MDIYVWSVDSISVEIDVSLLTSEKRRRAEPLPVDRRSTYIAARVALWQLLAHAHGGNPSNIEIDRRCSHCGDPDHGKPTVSGSAGEIDFSVSYSACLALIAVAFSTRVGVDIQERVAGSRPHRLCFSRSEQG